MDDICLTLPADGECAAAISAVAEEAACAADRFGAEVHLPIPDSSDEAAFAGHTKAVRELPASPKVTVRHLGQATQRDFPRRVIDRAGVAEPDKVLDLMLPAAPSYGACTNRCTGERRTGPGFTAYQLQRQFG